MGSGLPVQQTVKRGHESATRFVSVWEACCVCHVVIDGDVTGVEQSKLVNMASLYIRIKKRRKGNA